MRKGAALGTLVLAGAVSGCFGREGPTLRVLVRDPVVSLDPQAVDDRLTESVLSNVYDTLVSLERGYEPSLATSWSSPADDVWRFALREGVRFHDGRRDPA